MGVSPRPLTRDTCAISRYIVYTITVAVVIIVIVMTIIVVIHRLPLILTSRTEKTDFRWFGFYIRGVSAHPGVSRIDRKALNKP